MLGNLCKEANVKYYGVDYPDISYNSLAYSMTKEEAIEAANGLKKLAEKVTEIFPNYKHFLGKDVTPTDFRKIILSYAEDFEKSEGYECV